MVDVPPPPEQSPEQPPEPPPASFATPAAAELEAPRALSYGWTKFQDNIGPLLAVVAIPAAIQIVLGVVAGVTLQSSLALTLAIEVVSVMLLTIASLGLVRAALLVTADEPFDFGKVFAYDRWGEWFAFSVVFGLIVGVGIVLCLVPGLLAIAYLGLAPYYFVDQRMTMRDALRASFEAARRSNLAFPVLLAIFVGALGGLACGVGLFITEPVAFIAVGFLYRHATTPPVAT